jgi:hypothetical protein
MSTRPPAQRAIDQEIIAFFAAHNIKTSVIYRTCQDKFSAGEYPLNFVPKDEGPNTLRIAIEYENERIAFDNIRRIIACPGHLIDTLPRQEHVRLAGGGNSTTKPDKVDFDKVDAKFVFHNWLDLRARWCNMWE